MKLKIMPDTRFLESEFDEIKAVKLASGLEWHDYHIEAAKAYADKLAQETTA